MKSIKFYDVVSHKPVLIPANKVVYVTKRKGKRVTKFATARAPKGNKLFKIVG